MANFNFNKVIIGGRLTEDPVLSTTPSGVSVTSFHIAVNRSYKGEDGKTAADFFTVTAWRGLAEFITRWFRKASSVCVVGSLQTRSWTDKATGQKRYAVEIVADEAFFVDGKSEGMKVGVNSDTIVTPDSAAMQGAGEAAGPQAQKAYSTPGARGEFEEISGNEELPF